MSIPDPPGLLALRHYVDAEVRKLGDRQTDLDDRLRAYGQSVQQLAGDVSRLVGSVEATTPFHWPDLERADPARAAERWAKLQSWIDNVLVDYQQITRELRPCWESHGAAVAVVTAAWLTWVAAYRTTKAQAWDAVRWQRDVPTVADELRTILGSCGRDRCILTLIRGGTR